jgi:signal transduction histidine kinase
VTRAASIGWVTLAVATLAVVVAVFTVRLPVPERALAIDRALFVAPDGAVWPVSLPHRSTPGAEPPGAVQFRAFFDLTDKPADPLFLYIPSVNRPIAVRLNGETVFDRRAHALWSDPMATDPVLFIVPQALLVSGRNVLTVAFNSDRRAVPDILSAIYLGSRADVVPNFKLRFFLQERLRAIAGGAQILLGIAVLFAFFCRPQDRLFQWMTALVVLTSVFSLGLLAGFRPDSEYIRSYTLALGPGVGLAFVGVALIMAGTPPPKILKILAVALTVLLLLALATGIIDSRATIAAIAVAFMIGSFLAGSVIVARGALSADNVDARLMLAPFCLISCFAIRDFCVGLGVLDGSVLLIPYVRLIFLVAFAAMLMRRLAASLTAVDHANETLNRRLGEREHELDALHRKERSEAARLVREDERQRLTRDLHDGISGHLVSIIALAERAGGGSDIEQAARQALDDLRLVIYSLDLGDRELPLALANFRERLIPQLRRLGVVLDWSTADLPEVSGVTPANALTILRILQEAVTNALKHGPARRIAIRGMPQDGRAALIVENDGRPFADGKAGLGLDNMRRRADGLNGEIRIRARDDGTALTLLLPCALPDAGA